MFFVAMSFKPILSLAINIGSSILIILATSKEISQNQRRRLLIE